MSALQNARDIRSHGHSSALGCPDTLWYPCVRSMKGHRWRLPRQNHRARCKASGRFQAELYPVDVATRPVP
jgi:hypothetical protein